MREITWLPESRERIELLFETLNSHSTEGIQVHFPGLAQPFTLYSTPHLLTQLRLTLPTATFSTVTREDNPSFYFASCNPRALKEVNPTYAAINSEFVGLYDEHARVGFGYGDELGLFRSLVVGLASTFWEDEGYHPIHGSIMRIQNTGIGFVGGHGTGKTTSLLHLLYLSPHPPFQVLTDDWSFAAPTNNTITTTTFDKTIAVDPVFLEKYGYLKSLFPSKITTALIKKEYWSPCA